MYVEVSRIEAIVRSDADQMVLMHARIAISPCHMRGTADLLDAAVALDDEKIADSEREAFQFAFEELDLVNLVRSSRPLRTLPRGGTGTCSSPVVFAAASGSPP